MKIKKMIVMGIFVMLSLVCLCSCGNKELSEKGIMDSIPANFISINMEDQLMPLEICEMNILKRQTNEKDDNVFCTLVMSNSDYKVRAECYFQYNYYDKGGWILDCAEIQDIDVIPLKKVSEDRALSQIATKYMNWELVTEEFSSENAVTVYSYHVDGNYKYCAFSGVVDVAYTLDYNVEKKEDRYVVEVEWNETVAKMRDFSCVWNLEGEWYARTGENYELKANVYSVDDGSIDFDATNYYKGDPYNWYDGHLEYFRDAVKVTYDYSKDGDPSLSFSFTMYEAAGRPEFRVVINKNSATIRMDLYPTADFYMVE